MKISLFLISASVIAYQLLLLHNLSITQWYHFASLIISVALLGFGASGSFISLFRKRLTSGFSIYYPLLLAFSALMMVLSFRLIQMEYFVFDTYLIFSSFADMSKLLLTYLMLFIPFFFSAAAIGLTFSTNAGEIGKLYFINLTGSAFGGLIIIFLLSQFNPQQAVGLLIFLPVVAVYFASSGWHNYRLKRVVVILILTAVATLNLIKPPDLYLSEYKSLSKTLNMPHSEVIEERASPYGLLQVVRSPYIRYAPGLSLNYTGKSGIEKVVFNNGNWIGPLVDGFQHSGYYTYSTLNLPFIIKNSDNLLILESGTGEAVHIGLQNNASSITAVESNAALIGLLKKKENSVYNNPRVTSVKTDSYAYLLTSGKKYDLIHLPLYDAFGGASGIGALEEKPLLSQEAFLLMWNSLSPDGIITISAWIDTPLRYPLRLLASWAELLTNEDISNPEEHIIAIRNWSLVTYIITKHKVDTHLIDKVNDFSNNMGFDILLLPGIEDADRERFHYLSDRSLIELSDLILTGTQEERNSLFDKYSFDIRPVSENRPFPFHYIKLSAINNLLTKFTTFDLPYLEIGYFLVIVTLLIVIICAALFIILPLFFMDRMGGERKRTFLYFFSLGLGFLMVEIVLIQNFITYLGTPLYATTVIISTMLLFSGFGSNRTGKITLSRSLSHDKEDISVCSDKPILFITAFIASLIIMYALFLNPLLKATIGLPFPIKIILAIMIIAPLAFFMGMPFPLGIKHLNNKGEQASIAWAWGINGSMSVISSVIALLLAVQYGFMTVKLLAACSYLLAFLSVYVFRARQ